MILCSKIWSYAFVNLKNKAEIPLELKGKLVECFETGKEEKNLWEDIKVEGIEIFAVNESNVLHNTERIL